jgi:PAS domain S-box-containing protein
VLTLLLKQTKLKCAWQIALILLVVMAGAVLVLAFDSQKTLTQPGHDVWWRQNKMSASAVSILRDGTHQEAGVSFELYSLTPFYQTAWFYGLCLLGLLLLIAGLYKLRIKSLKKRELELEILVELNTRELREQRALLQEQKAYLRKIIDLIPSFIFAKDQDCRFILANQALAQAYGTTVEEIIGKSDADFNAQPDEVEKFRQDDLKVMASNTATFIIEEFTDKNGDRHWMQVNKIPLTSEDGTAHQLLGVATDITLQKKAA